MRKRLKVGREVLKIGDKKMFRNQVTKFIEEVEKEREKQLVLIYEKGHTRPPPLTPPHTHT